MNDTLAAGSGSESMFGGAGKTVFVAGSGDDFIEAGQTYGGGNTYVVNQGFGQVEIKGIQAADSIQFGSGITAADLSVTVSVGSDGAIDYTIDDEGGGSIVIDGGPTPIPSIDIDFADHSSTTLSQLLAAEGGVITVNTPYGRNQLLIAAADDTWVSSSVGDDTLVAGGMNDTLQAGPYLDWMYGGTGKTVFIVGSSESFIEAGQTNGGGNASMWPTRASATPRSPAVLWRTRWRSVQGFRWLTLTSASRGTIRMDLRV